MPRYLVYMVVNTLNGKYYVGAHVCKPDGACRRHSRSRKCLYMGSGKILKKALSKHGTAAFRRYVLGDAPSESEMYALEAEIVNASFVENPLTYNTVVGGRGGAFQTPEYSEEMRRRSHLWERTPEYCERNRQGQIKRFQNPEARARMSAAMKGRVVSAETRRKHSLANMGRPVSLETRLKMSLAKKGKYSGDRNPNYRHGKAGPPRRVPLYQRFGSEVI